MAKRKKRANVQPKKRAKPRRRHAAVRGKARKVSKSARGKGTKPTAGAKPQRAATKKAVRKKERRMKPPGPRVETVVVDVIAEPAPGVITVTRSRKRRYLQGGTNGRSVKAVSLSVADHQAQAERGTRSQAARLARKCPSAFFPSLAASAMLSKKTGECSTGADLPAQ